MDRMSRALTLAVVLTLIGCAPDSERPLRILTGGIMHESNTFNPVATKLEDFTIRRGQAATEGAPWAKALEEAGATIVVTAHAGATSGGVVTRKAYEASKPRSWSRHAKPGRWTASTWRCTERCMLTATGTLRLT